MYFLKFFQSVAQRFLRDVEDFNVSDSILQGIVLVFQFMHASVVEASLHYEQELSRHNYVTPTSYLELLSSYTELINKKKGSLTEGVGRLTTGKVSVAKPLKLPALLDTIRFRHFIEIR